MEDKFLLVKETATEGGVPMAETLVDGSVFAVIDQYRTLIAQGANADELKIRNQVAEQAVGWKDRFQKEADNLRHDLNRVLALLMEEAIERDWCSEYDDFIGTLESDWRSGVEIPTREKEIDVVVTISARITAKHGREDDAVETFTEDLRSDFYFDIDNTDWSEA